MLLMLPMRLLGLENQTAHNRAGRFLSPWMQGRGSLVVLTVTYLCKSSIPPMAGQMIERFELLSGLGFRH